MKSPITNLVMGCFLLLATSQLTAQTTTFSVLPQTITASPGTNITVDIAVEDFDDIVSFQYSMNWNPAILDFVSITNLTPSLPGFSLASSFGTTNTDNGKYSVSWLDLTTEGVTLADGVVLYKVTFTVLTGTGTNIIFSEDPTDFEVINGLSQEVTFIPENATVNGGGSNPPPPSGDLTFIASDETAAAGSNICVDISVENFDNITSFQYSMHWNTSILTYTGVQGFGLNGLVNANFNAPANPPGTLVVSWTDPLTSGVTRNDGTTIFQVCFNVIGSSGQSSAVTFNGTPLAVEASNSSGLIPVEFDNGSVTVNGGNPPPPPPPPPPVEGFALIASDNQVLPGESFCVEISVQDFIEIVSMQYTMEWNESQFTYTGIQGINLEGLTVGGNFGSTMTNQGILTLSWVHPPATGVTLADETIIYQVCFTATGPLNCSGQNVFEFNGSQTIIEIINADSEEVDFHSVPGEMLICDGDPNPTDPYGFAAGTMTAQEDEMVCVPITVVNPDCFASFQWSMHFNPAILDYETINFSLPGMSLAGNFNVTAASSGTITVSWFEPAGTGITLNDGDELFEICFSVIGNIGQSSPITFNSTPVGIEVINCNTPQGPASPVFTSGSVTVMDDVPCLPLSITGAIVSNVPCLGQSTGSIDLSAGGGSNAYTYVWKNAGGTTIATTQDITGLQAGQYCVTVTSCNGATSTNSCYTINQPASAMSVSQTVTNPLCFGESTGKVDVSVTGGTPTGTGCTGYTYLWNYQNATTQDLNNVPAGTYIVTVTDCNGCQSTSGLISVTQAPSALQIVSVVPVAVSCFGGTNGSITVTAGGGAPGYQYRLTGPGQNPTFGNSNVFSNLISGNYFVSVRDINLCIITQSVFVSTPTNIVTSAVPSPATNGCNGSINLTVSGGTAPYSYSWSNGTTAQDPANLCPGNFCVTITDANGCTKTGCELVVAPLGVTLQTVPACFNQCNGEIHFTINGGLAPFTFQCTNNIVGAVNVLNVCPGSFTCVVTSADGQTQTLSGTVGQANSAVSIGPPNIENVSEPGENDGSISITASGGFGPAYSYVWSNGGGNTATINNLTEGFYSVTVTDVSGRCEATAGPYEVLFDPEALQFAIEGSTICGSATNGTFSFDVSGGLPPFEFEVTGPVDFTFTDADGIGVRNDLPAGTYNVTVTDGAGVQSQTLTETVTIDEVIITLDQVTIFPITNAAANNGKIEISVTGGDIPYDYAWSNGFNGQNPFNIEEGCYDVTVVDNNGCAVVFQDICIEIFTASSTSDQPDCPGDTDGSITVLPDGSLNLPFTFVWTDENGQQVGDNSATLSDQPTGIYTVVITDALGREITQTFVLNSTSNLAGSLEITSDFNGFGVRCFGGTNGEATVTITGAVGDLTYDWSSGATSAIATDLAAGQITVTVTDEEGCVFDMAAQVTQPPALSVSTEANREGCNEKSGSATANPVGGVTPYTYKWNDALSQNSRTAIFLEGGIYNVIVVDDNGCVEEETADVPDYERLIVTGASEPDNGGSNGKAIVIVNEGTWPFEFQWSGFIEQDSILSELSPNVYIVIVTDASGCTASLNIRVDDGTVCLETLSVITPEGDGFNEEFKIGCLSRYNDNHLEIFNRWGQLIYQVDNYNDGDLWRGTSQRGDEAPDGVYFFVFDYLDPSTGARTTKKGASPSYVSKSVTGDW